ncbi:GntR family transcriptional regulator [Verticiella sediminum]|nr:GntR family transcriptional regulator [Verticiella sediminum]
MSTASSDTASDLIRERLKDDIVHARLWPGMTLDEKALAEQYGVSRTPVRDALLQLSALGFVRIVPRVGIFVAELDADTLADMFETLAHLEGLCAGLAARRIDADGRAALQRAHRAAQPQRARRRADGYDDANTAFHEVIYRSAGNDYLASQLRLLRQRTHPYRMRHFGETDRMAASCREHAAIVQAILDGDEAAAQRAATRHVVQGRADFSGFAARFPAGLFQPAPPRCGTGHDRYVMPSPWMRPPHAPPGLRLRTPAV